MKKYLYLLFVALFATMSFSIASCDSKKNDSPIYKLFESESSLREGLIGKVFVSEDQNCLMDFRRESRFKIFIKEPSSGEWIQFDGEKYRITYYNKDEVCIELPYFEQNGGDASAEGVFTPSEFKINFLPGGTIKFKDFRIISTDEAAEIMSQGK